MTMLVKLMSLNGSSHGWEEQINDACRALAADGRIVTDVRIEHEYNPSLVTIKHVPDQGVDHMAKAIAAENAIQAIIEAIRPVGDPLEEPHADPKTAYAAGRDDANRGVLSDLETVLARLRA